VSASALVLQHEASVPPGLLGEWMAMRGMRMDVVMVPETASPVPVAGYDLVASLGSVASVCGDQPWIARETEILQEAIARETPVLGLCFGGQSLAHALGAVVRPASRAEIGWMPVDSQDTDLVAPGPWFSWHSDRFDVPAGGAEVARSDVCPHAFTFGPHLGLQFHPEVDPGIVAGWAAEGTQDLLGAGVDPADLIAETVRRMPEARPRALALFDAFWERARRGA